MQSERVKGERSGGSPNCLFWVGCWLMFLALSLLIFVSGCATAPVAKTAAPAVREIPSEAFMTHRVVMNARGREFALTGYLAISQSRGMRLIVSESFGQQLADVLITPDGSVHVMKAGPMLKRQWIEKYLAADLKCLFSHTGELCPVVIVSPTHFVLTRRWYKLDLRIVETRPGRQPDALFEDAKVVAQ
jgi:hypothetical protein